MLASSSQPATSTTILASSGGEEPGATFVGASNAATDAGTSIALVVPAAAQAGDLLIAIIGHRAGSTGTVTSPAGWTAHTQVNSGTTLAQRLFRKVAGSSDLTTPHVFAFNAGTTIKGSGVLMVLRGMAADPVLATSGQANAAATSIAVPGLTMAEQSAIILVNTGKATSEAHSQATNFTLNAAATSASGGTVTTANRVASQYRSVSTANPPSLTVAAGTTAAVSIGQQIALAVGGAQTHTLTANSGSYTTTGKLATFLEPAMRADAGSVALGGVSATLDYVPLWSVLGTVGAAVGSWNDGTAQPSTTYAYRIVAINASGQTISNEDQATTFAASNYPESALPEEYALTGLDAELVVHQLSALSGSLSTAGAAATLSNPPLVWEVIDTVGGTANAYSDIGLDPGARYAYRVVAVNGNGETNSNQTNVVVMPEGGLAEQFTASAGLLSIVASDTPTVLGLSASANTSSVTGLAASLIVAHELEASGVDYLISASAASVVAHGSVTATAGSLSTTGVAATLVRVWGGQQAVPVADVSDGAWIPSTGTDLYPTIDETSDDSPVDTDYITTVDPVDDQAVVELSDINTPREGDVYILVRTRKG